MINNNSITANIRSDNALASILSNFESLYIINMVKDSINMRFRPYEAPLPSLYSIESNFVVVLNNVDITDREKVLDVRQKTYEEIIDEICKYYEIKFNNIYNDDMYSSAFWLYDFFVSNFTEHFFSFFINYIMSNKNDIFNYLNLDNFKKKSSSALYSKKIISDDKLALIHANIDIVLDNICAFDIHLSDLINYSSLDSKIKEFLINSIVDVNDNIFKTKYVPLYLDKSIRTDIITNIRLKMQEMLMQENNILNSI